MISIIVPVYNTKEYLSASVESLLNQTDPNLEIILVDDGSTDGSGYLCDEYGSRDSRVRVIHKKNGGLSSARNAGLDAASGAWIMFVDGDDYLAKWAVEQLLAVAKSYPQADFVQFRYQETDGSWQPEMRESVQEVVSGSRALFEKLYSMGGIAASACTKLYRRELFERIRFQENTRNEDEELMTRLLPACRKAVYTDLVLYGYVSRQGSIIHSEFIPKWMDVFPIMEKRITVLEELGLTELVAETKRRIFSTAAWQYCLARKCGFREESAQLKQLLLRGAKETNLPLTGQYRILHRLAGITPVAVDMYYFARRVFGKT